MAYYTLIPHIRNEQGTDYIANFCSGGWKVLYQDVWLELGPTNTRIRDKNNKVWIEPCNGHIVEEKKTDPNLDCKCYGKNFNEALNRELNVFAASKVESPEIEFLLYGKLLSVCDFEPMVYIAYYTEYEDKYTLKLYALNKAQSLIDNIVIDSTSIKPEKVILYVKDNIITLVTPTIKYSIDYDYTISANFEPSELPDYVTQLNGTDYRIVGTSVYANESAIGELPFVGQYSMLIYENELCISVYAFNTLSIFGLDGSLKGSSISEANSVFFFDRYSTLISVEGHETFIKIKGVDHV